MLTGMDYIIMGYIVGYIILIWVCGLYFNFFCIKGSFSLDYFERNHIFMSIRHEESDCVSRASG
jgi:hypothetical protein